jgi:WD40 repeat protein
MRSFVSKMRYIFFSFVLLASLPVQVWAQAVPQFELKATLVGHKGKVQNIRFSPNGQMLASGGHDAQVILWDVATNKMRSALQGHTGTIYEVTFNKDGSLLASASEDGTAKVWEVRTGKLLATFQNRPFLKPDGTRFVSVSFVVFSPDSRLVYFSGDNGYIMKGEIKPGLDGKVKPAEMIFSCNYEDGRWYNTVTGGTISADDKHLVLSVGQLVQFIDLKTEAMAKYFRYEANHLNDVINGPQPGHIATWSYDGKVVVWNVQTGKIVNSFQVANEENYSAASFNRDGRYLVSGMGGSNGSGVKVWDVGAQKNIATLAGHTGAVRIARFSPAENLIASGSYDGTVKVWRLKEPEPVVAKKDPEPVVAKNDPKPKPPVNQPKPQNKPDPKDGGITFKNEKVEIGKIIQLENILFEQSSYVLRKESYDELDKLLSFMKQYPTVEIELAGHTDNVGDPMKNQTLSERRVVAVKNFLMQRGVGEARIKTTAFGGSSPIAPNDSETGRQKNRRVEMKVLRV